MRRGVLVLGWVALLCAGCASAVRPGSGGSGSSADPHYTVAVAAVDRLLAGLNLPGGAHATAGPPVGALAQPPMRPASDHLLDHARWWTAPGTAAGVFGFLATHPPAGVSGSGSLTSGRLRARTYAAPATAAYTQATLVVSVVPDGSGVAIRADAQAIWLPTRSAASRIPLDVTAVDVTVNRRGLGPGTNGPVVHRTLGAGPARQLAAQIDALPVAPRGVYNCPADFGFTDTMVFVAGSRRITVVVAVGGCGGVTVNGGQSLSGGGDVDAALLRLVGLPARYGLPAFHTGTPTGPR